MVTLTQSFPPAATREAVARRIEALGALAVVRVQRADDVLPVAQALHAGGVSAIEVTMTVPGALDAIARLAREAGDDLLVGVGSVLDEDTARRAVEAGARFVVSPVFRPLVLQEAQRQGAAALPGAFTPTEILRAHEAGADLVKVFPSDALGPSFIKGVRAPMPFLKLCPTGGVTPENAGEWIRAGAAAVGLGSTLVDTRLVAAGDWPAITALARRTAESVAAAHGGAA
ncbi:bifunctional 4-hydroxy-2-oxoglutarate aldolase/2-dehydro-3-deoxy-phosphogluconate aldolase [Longimicrobium sp.]|uniref:bifunctional 4-hydroxy-2-oxoglutarate aldolase/2-dehydro-3-deoxy-phosphogluconate aldolase n=1 Tax=Longimicrobium sp. TaxID=2029185 RepID=UPI002E340A57|nr:bifunctional 4-hydroxy-2-oxoglutarate aldolase/2-dehydro-3-deoxy-phosphogluconate aldolase [Longimicrobium sp.]HEX6036898.1 bifunctional 4-hydroxy-2-oxoglutarate aldolase/2-dehydro-3-deoxy-phosphogluconate aldolase [Longimicrobium sp.]